MKKILSIILITIFSLFFVYTFSLSPNKIENEELPKTLEYQRMANSNIKYSDFKFINQKNCIYEFKPYGYINFNLVLSKNRVSEDKSLYMIEFREEVTPGICASNNGNDAYKNYLLDSGYMHVKVLQAVEEIDQATIRYGSVPKVKESWPKSIEEYNDIQINKDVAKITHTRSSNDVDELQWLFEIKNPIRNKMTFPLVSRIVFEMDNNSELIKEETFSLKVDFGININKKINIKNGKEVFAKKLEKTIYFNFF